MKLTGIFILALLSFAVIGQATRTVIADEGNRTGSSDDDYNEGTDVKRTAEGQSATSYAESSNAKLEEGEEIISTQTVESSQKFEPQVVTEEWKVVNPDGTISTFSQTRTIRIKPSKIIRTIKKLTGYSGKISTIRSLLSRFEEDFAQELTDDEYKLFNTIAATDGARYESKYSYVQVRLENLRQTLTEISKFFKSAISSDEIDTLEYQIRNCEDGGFFKVFETNPVEVHTPQAWTFVTEVILATCAKGKPAAQVFGYSASKSGTFIPGYYSEANDKTIDGIASRWLFKTLIKLFQCPASPKATPALTATYNEKGEIDYKTNA